MYIYIRWFVYYYNGSPCTCVTIAWFNSTIRYVFIISYTRQTRDIGPASSRWWANVADGGPTLSRPWFDVSCLLGSHRNVKFKYETCRCQTLARYWYGTGQSVVGSKARTFSIHCLHPFSALVPSWCNVGPECRRRWASTGPGRSRVSYLMQSI